MFCSCNLFSSEEPGTEPFPPDKSNNVGHQLCSRKRWIMSCTKWETLHKWVVRLRIIFSAVEMERATDTTLCFIQSNRMCHLLALAPSMLVLHSYTQSFGMGTIGTILAKGYSSICSVYFQIWILEFKDLQETIYFLQFPSKILSQGQCRKLNGKKLQLPEPPEAQRVHWCKRKELANDDGCREVFEQNALAK